MGDGNSVGRDLQLHSGNKDTEKKTLSGEGTRRCGGFNYRVGNGSSNIEQHEP